MRPKPTKPKVRTSSKQRLDHAEAVEIADWRHDCYLRAQASSPATLQRQALAARFARKKGR